MQVSGACGTSAGFAGLPVVTVIMYAMSLIETMTIDCPYCGERIELVIDASAGDQDYIEDCQVCCRPIQLHITVTADGVVGVEARRDDE